MISGKSIICFAGEDWWYHNPHSKNHIMKILARNNKVMFVNSIGFRFPQISDKAFLFRILNKIKSIMRRPRWVQDNLLVVSPVTIPAYGKSWARKLNRLFLVGQLKLWMKIYGFQNPILWIGMPTAIEVLGSLNESLIIYHCSDKFTAYEGASSLVKEMELELFKKADMVFFAADTLYKELHQLNANSFIIKHGVDFTHFSRAVTNNLPFPNDLANIPKPAVGYFGEINYAIDIELITYLAAQLPNVQFIFIGAVKTDISKTKQFKNIHFLGQKKYQDLPAYAKHFSACLVPWITNHDYDNHRSPIKIREYLATGRPVVAVDSPEIRNFEDLITIAKSKEEFLEKLKNSLHQKELRIDEMEKMKNETWEDRVEEISLIIEKGLNS